MPDADVRIQNLYCGLAQPAAPAVTLTADPTIEGELGVKLRPTDVHGVTTL